MQQIVPMFFEWTEHPDRWPDAPKGRTRREIIALKQSLPVFRSMSVPRRDISPDQCLQLAASLPPPTFDADRKLKQLDQLERQS
jgi:tRNA (guanine-N7-)-methyltransferase